MKVLLDTNVVLDAIARREPFCDNAQKIINLILDSKIEGYVTANSITDIYYIARKHLNQNDLRNTLRSLFRIFDIIDVFGADCRKAFDFPIDDYEDALLVVCGDRTAVDYIVTRDEEFLRQANIPVIAPADFVKLFADSVDAIS
jgi:predicted nucleic acid-binding protein